MNIRVAVRHGNGYRCSCCRNEWCSNYDFSSVSAAIDFANEIEAKSRSEKFIGDRSDVMVVEIIKTEEIEFKPDEDKIKKIMAEYEAEKAAEDKREEENEMLAERARLKKLLEKYPDMKDQQQ